MNSTDRAILDYQQRCFADYSASIGLPSPYCFPDGNPIRPLPPVQTTTEGLMIVGAYPSARFESRPSARDPKRRRLIPVADNLHPFAKEEYFDGQRVRRLESGEGIRRFLLGPLGLEPNRCWVTNLVKVFLYKPEHVDSCREAVPSFQASELRTRFPELGRRSLDWLRQECTLCRPILVLALGQEVAQVILDEADGKADDLLNRPITNSSAVGGFPVLCMPHPDACRRMEKWSGNIKARLRFVAEAIGQKTLANPRV